MCFVERFKEQTAHQIKVDVKSSNYNQEYSLKRPKLLLRLYGSPVMIEEETAKILEKLIWEFPSSTLLWSTIIFRYSIERVKARQGPEVYDY
jgi:hypothetical protein